MKLQLIGILATLGGASCLAAALNMRHKAQLALREHLNLVAAPREPDKVLLRGRHAKFEAIITEPVRRFFVVGTANVWGMRAGVLLISTMAIAAAIGAWILTGHISESTGWLPALLGGAAFFVVPRMFLIHQQRATERRFMELLPNGIDMMVRMLRAGLPISAAVRAIETDTSPPLRSVFGSIADQVALGVSFETALDTVSTRIGLPDFRFLSVALNLQHETGGNLAATLEILADLIRKRRAVRLKAAAATAEVRMSGYVLGALPVVTIGALLVLRPDYIEPLFYDERGKYILGSAAILILLAFLTMRQMMRRVTAA